MNNIRRKRLEQIKNKLDDVVADIQSCYDEEEEYYDNMPENLQNSIRGEMAQQAIDALDNAMSNIADALDEIDTAME